jgi:hypothetical protein
VPMPVLTLDVQRGGIPGHPGAKLESLNGSRPRSDGVVHPDPSNYLIKGVPDDLV